MTNKKIEYSIISFILINNSLIKDCIDRWLSAEHFSIEWCSVVYQVAIDLYKKNWTAEVAEIESVLKIIDKLWSVWGQEWLWSLVAYDLEVENFDNYLSELLEDKFKHQEKYFTLWLLSLDKKFGMPQIWDLMMFGGYPWSWKTEYAYFMARQNSNSNILYFTLELSETAMKKRLSRKIAWISKYDYQTKNYTDSQKNIMESNLKNLNSDIYKNIEFIHYDESPTVEIIIKDIKKRKKTQLVFIDAIGNMGGNLDEIKRLSHITQQLRLFVESNNVCIVFVHHMSKPKTAIEAMSPWWLQKFRGTQKCVDDSTLILEVWRDQDPSLEDKRQKATVKILQYKDTADWVTWEKDIFFNKWWYTEDFNLL